MLKVKRRGGSLMLSGTVAGTRVRLSPKALAGATTREEAEHVRVAVEYGMLMSRKHVPFRNVCEEYLATVRLCSRGSVNLARRLAKEFGGENAAGFDVSKVRDWSVREGHGPATTRRHIAQVKGIINWAASAGLVPEQRLRVALAPEPEPRDRFLESWADVLALVGHADPWFRGFALFLFGTGARLGQARELKGEALTKDGVLFMTRKGNSKKLRRTMVPLPPSLNGLVGVPGQYVFTAQRGGLLSERQVYRAWEIMCQRAGLVDFTPHDARRTYATLLIRKGVDGAAISGLLGHDSREMLRRYAYLAPHQKKAIVASLEAA